MNLKLRPLVFAGAAFALGAATHAQTDPAAARGSTRFRLPQDVIASQQFDPKQSGGLFVGVRKFDYGLAEIPYAVDDAIDLAHLFALELGLLDPSLVTLALAGEAQKAESRQRLAALKEAGARQVDPTATLSALLLTLPDTTGADGLFVASFATHGFDEDGIQLLAHRQSHPEDLAATGIRMNKVFDWIARAKAPRRIVLVDACRERLVQSRSAVASSETVMSEAFADAMSAAEGQVVLSATSLGGYSYDDPEVGNGVFTSAVLDGLRGHAPANDEALITAQDLATYVNEHVRDWVADHRPDHAKVSNGIHSQFGGLAASMPLAVDPDRLAARSVRASRIQAALARLKAGFLEQDSILTAAHFEQARRLLESPTEHFDTVLDYVEALDGSAHAANTLVFYLDSLVAEQQPPVPGPQRIVSITSSELRGLAARVGGRLRVRFTANDCRRGLTGPMKFLDYGVRWTYCRFRRFINLHTLEALSGVPVFLRGPHVGPDPDFDSEDFGYYNRAFVEWAIGMLPPPGDTGAVAMVLARVYAEHLREPARTYLAAHDWVMYDSEKLVALGFGVPDSSPQFPEQARITVLTPELLQRRSVFLAGISGRLQETGFDYWLAESAPGFWLRRYQDGTNDLFYDLLLKLMRAFDADYLENWSLGIG